MKERKKRWLSAAVAAAMIVTMLPLETAAFSFSDWLGNWTPPSREEMEQAANKAKEQLEAEAAKLLQGEQEQLEAQLKLKLGELYDSYKKLEQVDFAQIQGELKVNAVWPEGSADLPEKVEAVISDGVNSYPLTLTAENLWSGSVLVPLFQGKLDIKLDAESQFPQVIDYDVTAEAVDGFDGPVVQDFLLDFNWTQVEENWKPQASATLTYSKTSEEVPLEIVSYAVTSEWLDEEGSWFLRPNLTVQLLANGQPLQEPVTLSLLNNWAYTWQELPKNDEQGTISYSVEVLDFSSDYYKLMAECSESAAKLTLTQEMEYAVPLDVAVLWDHGENEDLPGAVVLNIGGEDVTLSGNDSKALWYFPEQAELPLLEDGMIADHSDAVTVSELQNYSSTVLTVPYYGEELSDEEVIVWLENVDEENMPQLLEENAELRWISIVWNQYEAPLEEEPQEPILNAEVDVLTLWNDEGVEHKRPDSITYSLINKDGVVKNSKSVAVDKSKHLIYENALLQVSGTQAELDELQLTEAFSDMHSYDRSLYLLKIPSSGIDFSGLSALTPEQLLIWAQQWSLTAPTEGYKLLALVINSRQGSGRLSIYKDVVDYDGDPLKDNTAFTYHISLIYPDLSTEIKTVKVSEDSPYLLEDLPIGTRYSVLESGRYGYINDDSDCLQSGIIDEGNNKLTFVNRKFNLIVRVDWSDWYKEHDDVRVYVDDNRYTLDEDDLWMTIDYARGISELSYRDIQARGIPEEYDVSYSISWRQHVAIVTVSAEYDKSYDVDENWDDLDNDDSYRVIAKVVWVGGDESNRPTVTAQLYRDGKSYRDPATLRESKNSLRDWRYAWEDVKGDEDNDWNVKVTKLPVGYSCEVTKVKDNYFIITCTWKDSKENVYTGA